MTTKKPLLKQEMPSRIMTIKELQMRSRTMITRGLSIMQRITNTRKMLLRLWASWKCPSNRDWMIKRSAQPFKISKSKIQWTTEETPWDLWRVARLNEPCRMRECSCLSNIYGINDNELDGSWSIGLYSRTRTYQVCKRRKVYWTTHFFIISSSIFLDFADLELKINRSSNKTKWKVNFKKIWLFKNTQFLFNFLHYFNLKRKLNHTAFTSIPLLASFWV